MADETASSVSGSELAESTSDECLGDMESPAKKRFKPGERVLGKSDKLEHRLGGILCCAVCLDLPRTAIYQVRGRSADRRPNPWLVTASSRPCRRRGQINAARFNFFFFAFDETSCQVARRINIARCSMIRCRIIVRIFFFSPPCLLSRHMLRSWRLLPLLLFLSVHLSRKKNYYECFCICERIL